MPNIQNVQSPIQGYSVAGYQAGDRIGAGVVVDPATISAKESKDTKLVNIDLDLDGQVTGRDDKVLVKLPPKGFIPADWKGSSTLSMGQKLEAASPRMLGHGVLGLIAGGIVGGISSTLASEKVFGAFLNRNPTGFGLAVGAALLATGVVYGYKTHATVRGIQQDEQAARSSSVPDVVQPKYILNQYLLQQPAVGGTLRELANAGK